MNPAADLAFFQNLYDGVSLYVVPEAASAAALPAVQLEAAAEPDQVALPASVAPALPVPPVPVAAPIAPSIQAPKTDPVPQPPVAPAKVPSPATLPTSAAAPVPPVVPPSVTPTREPVVLTLAELPAATAAPAGRVQPTPTQSPVAHIPFSTLGSNPNGLIILVRLSENEFRKLPRNVFLNNILKAIRLIVEDVVLVNVEHASYPVALCTLRQTLGARQFLAFGKNLLDVAVYTTQPYEPVLLFGDTAFLGAGEISMLEYDAGRKKQLWQAMQRMFM
jgi:hypothetical protein